MRKTCLYDVLGVDRTASIGDIKKAYRNLARQHHPDCNPGDKVAEDRFKVVASAYEILGNEERRALYDRFGHAAFDLSRPAPQTADVKNFKELADLLVAAAEYHQELVEGLLSAMTAFQTVAFAVAAVKTPFSLWFFPCVSSRGAAATMHRPGKQVAALDQR